MPHEIKIPALGESVTGGQISKWNFKDGDYVKTGDILLVLETDKVAAEVTAEASGALTMWMTRSKSAPSSVRSPNPPLRRLKSPSKRPSLRLLPQPRLLPPRK